MNENFILYSKNLFGEIHELFLVAHDEEQVMEVWEQMFPDNEFYVLTNYS